MGTRRSRHNKGRKPLYKDHREVASNILARKRYGDFPYKWHDTNLNWTPLDEFKLGILCEADAEIEEAADALGRKPSALAHRARENGIVLPLQWLMEINPNWRPRQPRIPKRRIIKPRLSDPSICYPYISKPRDEHAQLLAVNAIIPSGIPEHMRADMCQEILLAVLEGRTTLEQLKARKGNSVYFIKKFYDDNYEQGGHAISFNDTNEDWDSDAVASSIASKEWRREQFQDRNGYTDVYKTFTPPTQFEAAYRDQVGRIQLRQHELGQFLSVDEVEQLISGDA